MRLRRTTPAAGRPDSPTARLRMCRERRNYARSDVDAQLVLLRRRIEWNASTPATYVRSSSTSTAGTTAEMTWTARASALGPPPPLRGLQERGLVPHTSPPRGRCRRSRLRRQGPGSADAGGRAAGPWKGVWEEAICTGVYVSRVSSRLPVVMDDTTHSGIRRYNNTRSVCCHEARAGGRGSQTRAGR